LILSSVGGLFLQLEVWDLIQSSGPLPKAVMVILLCFSLTSWAVILSKWAAFRRARSANRSFLRAFRKAPALDTIAAASEQFHRCPLVAVFDFGYSEVARQMKSRGSVTNPLSLERTLQLGLSEELTRLERNMSILATTAGVSPFIGLFGTVWALSTRSSNWVRRAPPACVPSLQVSRRRSSPLRWVFSPQFPRTFSTTFLAARSRNSPRGWKTSCWSS
jgi:hypothetical protein